MSESLALGMINPILPIVALFGFRPIWPGHFR
jgi:hypothetical protein